MNTRHQDDFTQIDGIGPARQKWLRETFGISTFRELAALSVEAIEAKASKQVGVTREDIANWLEEASARVSLVNHHNDTSEGWRPFASFVVELQRRDTPSGQEERTAIHYLEKDRGSSWPGVDVRQLGQWMLDQTSLPAQAAPAPLPTRAAEPAPAPVAEMPASKTPAPQRKPAATGQLPALAIRRVRILQLPQTAITVSSGAARLLVPDNVRKNEAFALETDAEIVPGLPKLHQETRCSAVIQAKDLQTGVTSYLGTVGPIPMKANQTTYTLRLPTVTLGEGLYMVSIIAKVRGQITTFDYFEIPMLRVA